MKTEPIKLTENIYAVAVPKDAIDFKIADEIPFGEKHFCSGWNESVVSICELKGNFEILGEVIADEITFDCVPYVDKKTIIVHEQGIFEDVLYFDYAYNSFDLSNPKESFYSLLQSKGKYFVNPIEKPELPIQDIVMYRGFGDYETKLKQWQESESKVVEKVVIIKKV